MILGIIMMVAGFASSLSELLGSVLSEHGGLFNGECKLSYAYAPQSPHDPCNASGIPLEGQVE